VRQLQSREEKKEEGKEKRRKDHAYTAENYCTNKRVKDSNAPSMSLTDMREKRR
jgi:hypothetical protein